MRNVFPFSQQQASVARIVKNSSDFAAINGIKSSCKLGLCIKKNKTFGKLILMSNFAAHFHEIQPHILLVFGKYKLYSGFNNR